MQQNSQTITCAVYHGDDCKVFRDLQGMHERREIFKQEWFQHIHEYMKEDGEQSKLWKSVLFRAKVAANDLDQRIVISTISYHVHDLMTEKVKEFQPRAGPN